MPQFSGQTAGPSKGLVVLCPPPSVLRHSAGWWNHFLCALILLSSQSLVWCQEAPKVDYCAQFLEKLRERGWHDVALDYLERAEDDPLASPEFLASVGYQVAITQSALARQAVGAQERQSLLNKAISGFQEFANDHPESPHSITALSQVGNMLAEQALVMLDRADRLAPEVSSEQEKLRADAREIIDRAAVAVDQLLAGIEEKLAQLPRGAALQAQEGARQLKQDLLSKQAEGRFLSANLNFEKARTYPKNSESYGQALEQAADGFRQLGKEYENKLVGYYAILYEGRCYQQAGDLKNALKAYDEVIRQPVGQSDFRKLAARATRYRIECLLASGDIAAAIEEGSNLLDQSRAEELTEPEWLTVSYRLADAYSTMARSDAGAGNVSRLRADARKLYREVSQHAGEFQDDARAALALSGTEVSGTVAVKGFADAFSEGKLALERMSSSQLAVRLATNNNPEAVEDLKEQVATNRTAAIEYFRKAVELSDEATPAEDSVAARYYLCWLYWEDGRTTDAAELGKTIASDFPDSPYAPTAAKVALAAYERIYIDAKRQGSPSDVATAIEQLRSIAELIVDRWNDSDVATTAINLLVSLALHENDFDAADRLLEKLPAESRGAAGLSLGASLWTQYLEQTTGKDTEPSARAEELKSRAAQLLKSGYESLSDASNVSAVQAAGVLYYVQLLLAEGEVDKAAEVLENERVGPLKMAANAGSENVDRAFAVETYKAALRTYLSLDPPRSDDAIVMMEKLEASADGSQAEKQLTAVYVSLGLQLQEQVKRLTSSGDTPKARTVAAAFSTLLQRVADRSSSQSWAIRNWLAQTSLQLGSGLTGPERDRYLKQAEDAYRDILITVEKNPAFAPDELAVLAVRKKLGETLQARGDFRGAMEQYSAVLQDKPNLLELQRAAAAALQEWGLANKQAARLDEAIHGTNPSAEGRNQVWGWLQLATIADYQRRKVRQSGADTDTVAKYEDVFFDARYQAARARLEAGKLASGDSRTTQLRAVRQSVLALKELYPNLGGEAWQARFDALLNEVDSLLGGDAR